MTVPCRSGLVVHRLLICCALLAAATTDASMVSYFDFDNVYSDTATTVADRVTGSSHTLRLNGSAAWTVDGGFRGSGGLRPATDPKLGGFAIIDDGPKPAAFRSCIHDAFDFTTSPFTWFLRFKMDRNATAGLLSRTNASMWSSGDKTLFANANGDIGWDTSAVSQKLTSLFVADGQWHSVIATFDISIRQLRIFRDDANSYATYLADDIPRFPPDWTAHQLVVGYTAAAGGWNGQTPIDQFFDGVIDDVAIYNAAVTLYGAKVIFENGPESFLPGWVKPDVTPIPPTVTYNSSQPFLPYGMIVMQEASGCPDGWVHATDLDGYIGAGATPDSKLIGVSLGGDPLGDREYRAHSHHSHGIACGTSKGTNSGSSPTVAGQRFGYSNGFSDDSGHGLAMSQLQHCYVAGKSHKGIVPTGTVALFVATETKCPPGWAATTLMDGRIPIGVGAGSASGRSARRSWTTTAEMKASLSHSHPPNAWTETSTSTRGKGGSGNGALEEGFYDRSWFEEAESGLPTRALMACEFVHEHSEPTNGLFDGALFWKNASAGACEAKNSGAASDSSHNNRLIVGAAAGLTTGSFGGPNAVSINPQSVASDNHQHVAKWPLASSPFSADGSGGIVFGDAKANIPPTDTSVMYQLPLTGMGICRSGPGAKTDTTTLSVAPERSATSTLEVPQPTTATPTLPPSPSLPPSASRTPHTQTRSQGKSSPTLTSVPTTTRHRGAGASGSFTVTPTISEPVPTPQPEEANNDNTAFVDATSGIGVASASVSSTASAGAASQIARAQSTMELAEMCSGRTVRKVDNPLPIGISTTGMTLGDDDVRYHRGAAVGNAILVVAFAILGVIASVVVGHYQAYKDPLIITAESSAFDRELQIVRRGMARIRFPSALVFPILLLQDGMVAGAATAMMRGTSSTFRAIDLAVFVVVFALLAIGFAYAFRIAYLQSGEFWQYITFRKRLPSGAATTQAIVNFQQPSTKPLSKITKLVDFGFNFRGTWMERRTAAGDLSLQLTGGASRQSVFYGRYMDTATHFLLIDGGSSLVISLLRGTTDTSSVLHCRATAWVNFILNGMFLAVALYYRPYTVHAKNLILIAMSGVTTVGALLVACASVVTPWNERLIRSGEAVAATAIYISIAAIVVYVVQFYRRRKTKGSDVFEGSLSAPMLGAYDDLHQENRSEENSDDRLLRSSIIPADLRDPQEFLDALRSITDGTVSMELIYAHANSWNKGKDGSVEDLEARGAPAAAAAAAAVAAKDQREGSGECDDAGPEDGDETIPYIAPTGEGNALEDGAEEGLDEEEPDEEDEEPPVVLGGAINVGGDDDDGDFDPDDPNKQLWLNPEAMHEHLAQQVLLGEIEDGLNHALPEGEGQPSNDPTAKFSRYAEKML